MNQLPVNPALPELQQGAYRFLTRYNLINQRPIRFAAAGHLGPWLRLARWVLIAGLCFNALAFGTMGFLTILFAFSNPAVTSLMMHRGLDGTKVKPVLFIPLKNITAGTRNVFIELEDHDFYSHFGVSPGAIKEAMRINKLIGKTVVGGSTITQQLARNLFLTPKKTYIRKFYEAGAAVMLELILGKKRIMELYLNYIEFGPGIFGLGQAAHYQYGATYRELDFEQRVRLAVIITSPLRYNVRTFTDSRGMLARYYAIMGSPEE